MPKVDIDYSNTIFYKIYCKDSAIDDLYIGHTTNFVQRKHAHKQGCTNNKSSNYNCKLYQTMRDNMGWDNWTMEIIAFHNCDNLYAAKKLEQSYFEDYKATLNSIEPLPKPKPKPILMKYTHPNERPHCEVCDVYFGSNNLLDIHYTTNKHRKNVTRCESMNKETICSGKFICKDCDYYTSRESQYKRHLSTTKHTLRTNGTDLVHNNKFECECGKIYSCRQNLYRHKQMCKGVEHDQNQAVPVSNTVDSSLVIELLKQNQEFKEMMIEQHKRMTEQQDTIIELSKNAGNTTNNNTINNTTNNKFNLNVFLNETCKDAINLNDFI